MYWNLKIVHHKDFNQIAVRRELYGVSMKRSFQFMEIESLETLADPGLQSWFNRKLKLSQVR